DGQQSPRSCRKSRHLRRADCDTAAHTSLQSLPRYGLACRGLDREVTLLPLTADLECQLVTWTKHRVRLRSQAQPQADCSAARSPAVKEAAKSADAWARSQ